jgi:hypothetical protein
MVLLLVFITFSGCGSEANEARRAVEEHLKGSGVKEIQVDLFLKPVDIPDKAYVSVTVTWGFATQQGTPQKEFLGFIMKKDGSSWKVASNSGYTTDRDQARSLLEGRKT